jgi:hypothetical protein
MMPTGLELWSIVVKDGEGKILADVSGKATRGKNLPSVDQAK